ncbi:FUSC family protein [Legionella taurinensis]|uniref:FUSC family protein n=1 Tax=Legionella taurinensis TaxID=70611 RepID=A0A3A5LIV0_9GAMM|nr:FUSC family protein [Legionella taurinensis]PUT44091.1 FUSC family protein [Legionella taurinensis]PUT47392.1 FUSC family protein [Legionella taurinensis]PUT48531.1 FUSC family protein [Legionella taurinensis]RJT47897.1 FUSC family protein [Legionella taurinensis]
MPVRQPLPTAEALAWFKPFIPQSKENRAAVRTAVSAVAAVLLAFALHLDKPYWSGMTTVILANIYTGSIIDKAIMRIAGTLAGAWGGYFLAGYIANSFLLYLLSAFLLVTIAVYYYNFSVYAYAYLLGAISAFIVIADLAIAPEQAFWVAVWRPIEIGLGVLVSAAAAFCLFPINIHDALDKEVGQVFTGFQQLIRAVQDNLLVGHSSVDELRKNMQKFKKSVVKATDMLGYMRREVGFKREKIDQLRVLFDSFYSLNRSLHFFISSQQYAGIQAELTAVPLPLAEVFSAIIEDLDGIKCHFLKQTDDGKELNSTQALQSLDAALSVLTARSSQHQQAVFAISHLLRQFVNKLQSLQLVLVKGQKFTAPHARLISRKQRLQTDPDIIKHSIKAGLSVILALCFWLISNWPGGLNGLISSIVISIRKSIYEMKNISLYRLLGCLAGGGLALFSLASIRMDLYDLIIILWFGVWAFSYFSFKYTAYAYIGLQANIALIITLAQAGGPPIGLDPPLERLGGILIGITSTFLVANALWRSDTLTQLTGRLHKLSRYLHYNVRQLLAPESQKKPLYDLTSLFWFCRGLLETLEQEDLPPKKQPVFDEAKQDFQNQVLLQATITHVYDYLDQDKCRLAAAKAGWDLRALEAEVAALFEGKQVNLKPSQVKKQLEALRDVLLTAEEEQVSADDMENSVVYLGSLIQLAIIAEAMARNNHWVDGLNQEQAAAGV